MELKHITSEITGEEMYCGTHPSGLGIYLIPKKGYSETYAIFGTRYGSVDSKFTVPGETEVTEVPDGIAHYLEHKMFDQPDGSNVFDKFAKYGGNANAFTSFNMTAYLFTATEHVEENLAALMDYVQSPYYTDETVQKEQGIIGQEIKMYDDSGNWKLFFNLLNCLYKNHPVKKEIAGTVESISHITPEYLYKCYNTFYNLSNMSIVVVGGFNVKSVLDVIEKGIKKNEPFTEEIKKIYEDEPDEIAKPYAEQSLSVASPLFMIGFKDTDTGYGGERLLKKYIEVSILLKMLFGKSSRLYKELYESGLINNTFQTDYTVQPSYAYSVIEGESRDSKAVYETVKNEIERVKNEGLSEDDFNRIKKVMWGQYIRSHNDVEDYAGTFMQFLFMGADYFNYHDAYAKVTFDGVKRRFENHFVPERSALSVINPV